jgi:hypothetical protein
MLRFFPRGTECPLSAVDVQIASRLGVLFRGLGEFRLDAMTKSGALGGWHESLEAEFLIAKLERLAALGDIFLLRGQVRHLYILCQEILFA